MYELINQNSDGMLTLKKQKITGTLQELESFQK